MRTGHALGPQPAQIPDVPEAFDFVELAIGEAEIVPADIDTNTVQSDLSSHGLDLAVHLPFRQPLATSVPRFNEAVLAYQEELLEFAAELGAEKAVVHANMRDPEDDDQLEVLAEQIQKLRDRSHGVELCFENVAHIDTPSMYTVADILDAQGGRMCFDIGHAFQEGGQFELEDFLETFPDLISHLHIHDVRQRGDSHIAVGEGDIDYTAVGRLLSGFDGTAAIEVFGEDLDYAELSREKFLVALNT